MVQEKSKVVFSAEDSDLQEAWRRQFAALNRLNRLLEQAAKRSNKTSQDAITGLRNWAVQFVALDRVAGLALATLRKLIGAAQELREQGNQRELTIGERQLRLATQLELKGDRRKEVETFVAQTAIDFGIGETQTLDALQQLISSGANIDDAVEGGLLRSLLTFQAVTPGVGGEPQDPAKISRSFAQFLKGNDLTFNKENFDRVAPAFVSQFLGRDVQVAELGDLAKIAAGLKQQGISEEDQIALFSVLDVLPAEQRAVGLRNVIGRINTAAIRPNKVKALESIGLTPDDITIGENRGVVDSLLRLGGALDTVNEQRQIQIATLLFEERGKDTALLLFSKLDELGKAREQIKGGPERFNSLVDIVFSDLNFAIRQKQEAAAQATREDDAGFTLLQRASDKSQNPTLDAVLGGFTDFISGGNIQARFGQDTFRAVLEQNEKIAEELKVQTDAAKETAANTARQADAAEKQANQPLGIPPAKKPAGAF